jgi:ribosomal protein L11 methyltransferase
MSRNNKITARTAWAWRRWIAKAQCEFWSNRLEAANAPTGIFTERPDRTRILLEVYSEQQAVASALARRFGGRTRRVKSEEWIQSTPAPPLRIGRKLEIVHAKTNKNSMLPQLQIPHGVAFGSGDHATTHMLLRALTQRKDWAQTSVLDLGTGSGVLALAARLFGACKIVATDFDAEAVRTARQNELLNFPESRVRWQCADVKRLRAKFTFDLVVANIFSEILCQAAPQIAGSVSPGGQLWLSGILRSQQEQVVSAYRRQKLHLDRAVSRGKWIMLQWSKPL